MSAYILVKFNSMNIHLTPEQEEIIRGEIENGHCGTAEEVIARALQNLLPDGARLGPAEKAQSTLPRGQREAVLEMLDFAKKHSVRLEDVSIKDLIHQGHRL
ncbi:MAG TPA: hypothetical protein VNW97_23005 [Candidatus Saccharimonadales bacterium]|jgi:hypothetical protein|nr:hypothetical protein [Candidatus Saccharimonadales bacterium]